MQNTLDIILNRLVNDGHYPLLNAGLVGLEKESMRVSTDGHIAQTPHPDILGAALTNRFITTDYSEALLEFVTPPFPDIRQALDALQAVHQFCYRKNPDELLWNTSMPCVVDGEVSIPIAEFGSSNQGRFKHVYRQGLGYRYGKTMQVIAGIHFNYSVAKDLWPLLLQWEGSDESLQAFRSRRYFGLIRNAQRHAWLLSYLFGASPALCKSFLKGKDPGELEEYNDNTFLAPLGTSLRLSDVGYTNSRGKRRALKVRYDSLDSYLQGLSKALKTPWPAYQKIGVCVDGRYRQLNDRLLQIENEYYTAIRPKQIPEGQQTLSQALAEKGVEYVELRVLDINLFEPVGITESQGRFLEMYLLFCLLSDSPPVSYDEWHCIERNNLDVACRGRDPDLLICLPQGPRRLTDQALDILSAMSDLAALLDQTGHGYRQALEQARETVNDSERTPAARLIADMKAHNQGFFHTAQRWSQHHRDNLIQQPLDADSQRLLEEEAEQSRIRQHAIEASDTLSFSDYIKHYFQNAGISHD